MVGRSYAAAVQWLGALEQPPHLRAISPIVTGSDFFDGWIYEGGAFQLGFNLFWIWLMSNPREANRLDEVFTHLPLRTLPIADLAWARLYAHWVAHSTDDAYWRALSINRRYASIDIPAFIVGGWYDVFVRGTLENFVGVRTHGSEAARAGTRLVIGPWAHGSTYGPYPDHSFPAFAPHDALDVPGLQLRFFARHLRGDDHADDDPAVRVFVMGENRWRNEETWPPARAAETAWFLRAGGRLSLDAPADEPADEYVYDPADPAPTIGGPTSLPARMMKTNTGPLDQRRLDERPDVLLYTSEPLDEALDVIGPLELVLYAATSAPDTDFVAKLIDVSPDGPSVILTEGVLRTRFREGFDREVLGEPGRAYEYAIALGATGNVFLPGHRLRLAITSSSFPRFDRNPNTGAPLGVDGPADLRAARQTIFHDSTRPSRLMLPVATDSSRR